MRRTRSGEFEIEIEAEMEAGDEMRRAERVKKCKS